MSLLSGTAVFWGHCWARGQRGANNCVLPHTHAAPPCAPGETTQTACGIRGTSLVDADADTLAAQMPYCQRCEALVVRDTSVASPVWRVR